jgi:hypothetical protein
MDIFLTDFFHIQLQNRLCWRERQPHQYRRRCRHAWRPCCNHHWTMSPFISGAEISWTMIIRYDKSQRRWSLIPTTSVSSGHFFVQEYEFNKFSVYAKIISPHARSIGIITSPFAPIIRSNNDTNHTSDDSDDTKRPAVASTDLQQGLLPDATVQIRAKDSSAYLRARCRVVTTALVDYLQARHPMSRITVHNGPNETVMSSYIRLIMANQTIAGLSSTFGLYPAIASFGTAYLSSPYYNETVPRSRWIVDEFGQANDLDSATSTISQSDKSVVIVQDNERAKVSFIQQLWESEGRAGILAWFQS